MIYTTPHSNGNYYFRTWVAEEKKYVRKGLKTKVLKDWKTVAAIKAENIGDKNQDKTIPPTPPTNGNVSNGLYQITQLLPPNAIAIPTIPPTQEWVVETGISR